MTVIVTQTNFDTRISLTPPLWRIQCGVNMLCYTCHWFWLPRGLCCCPMFSVRLSVRHIRVLHIQMAEDIVELLSRPDSPVILVFDPEKDLRFSPEIAVYLGNGCYATLVGSHRWRIDPCRFRWPWVTLKGGTRWVIFQAHLLNNARTVWPKTIKFGRITHVGEECISGGQLRPYRKGPSAT